MPGNFVDMYDNPAVNYSISRIIESYNWSSLAYGFDMDFERIKRANPTLTFSSHELMCYFVRSFLCGDYPDKSMVFPLLKLDIVIKIVDEFLDNNSRKLIMAIAKQQILDSRDASAILLHFLTIPELERFYGRLVPHGFPSVIIATSYMISEAATVCYDAYNEAYAQRLGIVNTLKAEEATPNYA